MQQKFEALTDSYAALDHHSSRGPAAQWIGRAIAANLLIGGVFVLGAAPDQNTHPAPEESVIDASVTHSISIPVAQAPRVVKALPTLKPEHLVATRKITPTETVLPVTWRNIALAGASVSKHATASRLAHSAVPRSVTDLSWPQCVGGGNRKLNSVWQTGQAVIPQIAHSLSKAPLAILGINGGRPFLANRCLTALALVPEHYDVYFNVANPGREAMIPYAQLAPDYNCNPTNDECIARDYGRVAINYSLQLMKQARMRLPENEFWLDVEKPALFNGNPASNRALMQGMIDELHVLSPTTPVGIYSTPHSIVHPNLVSQYDAITGGWRNGLDAWITTGAGNESEAHVACKTRQSFTGGPVIYSQGGRILDADFWQPPVGVDSNVRC